MAHTDGEHGDGRLPAQHRGDGGEAEEGERMEARSTLVMVWSLTDFTRTTLDSCLRHCCLVLPVLWVSEMCSQVSYICSVQFHKRHFYILVIG